MIRKKFNKLTSGLMIGMVGASLIGPGTIVFATGEEMVATSSSSTGDTTSTQVPIAAKERASVHDPSIVKDKDTGEYYVFGSHIEAAKSLDLQNWDKFTNSYTTPGNRIFGDLHSNLAGSFAWAGENDSDSKGTFAVWAPNVIYNPDYDNGDGSKGAYMMYYCTSSTYKRSAIGYAVSQNIDGPYTYVDTIIYSGFTNKDANDTNSTINTNVTTLTSEGRIPTDVNPKWFNADGSYNTSYAPNAIDPELFWDKDGTLWMNYGSWSGGIFMLEIDKSTGKPIYPGTTGENTSDAKNYTDRFFGRKIAGGYTDSGEGAEIVYDKANGYYYLTMSYAGLAAQGGYNIRMFRSTSPTGPFVDEKGQNAALASSVDNTAYGIKLIGNYKFNCLDVGYRAAGHNSSFIDDNGQMYLIYHTRFDDGTENHEVRVHQMFINEEGWPVVAPYEYSGDKILEAGYSKDDIVGDYQFINHGTSSGPEMLDTLNVRLNANGTISGDVTGSWSETDGSYYMKAVIDGVAYKGVFFKQQDESNYENKVMTFSAVGTNNEVIWGSKLELSDSEALSYVENVITNDIPSSTKTDLTLPESGPYGTTISWSSSDKDLISTNGKVNRPVGEDKTVTITAIISKNGQSVSKEFSVAVKGKIDFTGVPLYQYDFSTADGTSIENSGSVGATTSAAATLVGNTSVVDDENRGKVLQLKSTDNAINSNYLALPNDTFSEINENGFTVGMWVNVDDTDPNYFVHSALFEADCNRNYPMTRIGANLIARINSNGSYSDTGTGSLKSSTWQYLTYTVSTKGIIVYVNGVEVTRQDKDITASLANNVMKLINNVRVGSGSIWNDKDLASAKFDNVAIYDTALTDQEVEGLYNKELGQDAEVPDEPGTDPSDDGTLQITKQPSNLTVNKGNSASFSVEVLGTDPLTYQWQKDKKDLADDDRINGANEATLTIENVLNSDEGDYDCIITDGEGNVTTSSAATLTVKSNSSSSKKKSKHNNSNSGTNTNNGQSSNTNTIVINANNTTGSSQTSSSQLLTQDVLTELRSNTDKTIVIKIGDASIEIKNKNGQVQFTQDGNVITGLKSVGQTKYYLDSNGIMQTGWVQTPGETWYYFDKTTGAMKTDWIQDTSGSWYFLDKATGAMKKGWLKDTNGSWYYLNGNSGRMQTGWIQDNGKWYYLNSNGSLAVTTTIDGYAVDENGEWIR